MHMYRHNIIVCCVCIVHGFGQCLNCGCRFCSFSEFDHFSWWNASRAKKKMKYVEPLIQKGCLKIATGQCKETVHANIISKKMSPKKTHTKYKRIAKRNIQHETMPDSTDLISIGLSNFHQKSEYFCDKNDIFITKVSVIAILQFFKQIIS